MNETVACRICLANNVKLYDVNVVYNLKAAYETMTGTQISIKDGLPQQICSYCSTLLLKYISFKEKCCYTQDLYKYLLRSQKEVTKDDVVLLQKQFTNLSQSNILPIMYMQYVEPTIKEEFEVNLESFMKFEEEVVKKRKKKVVKKKKLKSETNYQDVDTKFEDIAGVDMDSDGDQENHVDTVMLRGCGLLLVKKAMEGTTEESKPIKQNRVKTASKDEDIDLKEAEMVILSKEEQLEEMEARKASSNYTQSVYKCDLCYRGFITEATYNNHMVRHDPKSGDFVCDICNFRWTEARFLRSHVVTSHERKYLCKLCDHVSRSSYRAKEHIKWHNGFKFECKICGATFAKSTSKLTHMRLHHPSKHSCEICGESFIGEYGLKMHKRRAHRDIVEDTTHQCLQCEVSFQSIEALAKHMEESKNGLCDPNLSPCVQCGEGCENDELLKSHVKEHQNSFTCEECERSFNNSRSYSIHYQRVHLGVKLKQYKPSLRRAADTVVCEICGKKCITRATLRYHQRTHTGEKPYQCTDCPKKFSVFQRLQIHRRTHTGECPYKCKHCPKAFKHKAALNRHDRVHTGEKPYTCSHCGKSFSQSNSRKLHMNTVHLKMPAPYRNRKTT